jgi:uncharacterized membrane protein
MPFAITRRSALGACAGALAAFTPLSRAAAAPVRYHLTDLGDIGGKTIDVNDVNDHGVATGMATRHDGDHQGVAFVSVNGRMHGAGFQGSGHPSYGMAINNNGLVAGYDRGLIYPPEPNVCWIAGRDGVRHVLPPAEDGTAFIYIEDLNDAGVVVGSSGVVPLRYMNGRTESLGLPDGYTHGHARAVNREGDVVGVLYGPTEGTAFVCFDGVIQPLDIAGAGQHEARGVNRLRQVCGTLRRSGNGAEPGRPFVWQNGQLQLLHWPGRRSAVAQATALNDDGSVVGIAYQQGLNGWSVERAFVAFDGVMHDMNDLLEDEQAGTWVLHRAASINQHGQIVGKAWRQDLQAYRGYLATPLS